MLKFSTKKGRGLNFTAGTSKIDEVAVLEAIDTEEAKFPEDMMAFIASLDVYEALE